jgi:hypothetical protein
LLREQPILELAIYNYALKPSRFPDYLAKSRQSGLSFYDTPPTAAQIAISLDPPSGSGDNSHSNKLFLT